MLAELFDQHVQMLAAGDALLAGARRQPPMKIQEFTQLRIQFANLVRTHLNAETTQLISPLLASARLDEIPAAQTMFAELRHNQSLHSDHVRKWTMQAVDADRDGYTHSLAAMVDMLHRLTEREEAELYWPAIRILAARDPDRKSG